VSGPGREPIVVIGVGNEFRRDDGAGPAVVARLRGLVPPGVELVITDGEPTRLIEAWTGAALAVVVDAVRAEPSQPGRVHRFVVDRPGAGAARTASSHGLGLDDAIALALALDRMPGRLVVHAIEAADLTQGSGLTPAVDTAVGVVAAAILDDIGAGRQLSVGPRSEPKDPRSRDLRPWPMPVAREQRWLRHPPERRREMPTNSTDHAGLEILPFDRCLQLLATVPVGRVSFFADGEIVVLPVNHVMDGPNPVFRTASGSKLSAAEGQNLVAFEVDAYDERTRSGWSVLVNGRVEVIYEEAEIQRLTQLELHPWVTAVDRPFWIRIRPSSVSGRQTPRND
jgi:hydrogenase maturation protease